MPDAGVLLGCCCSLNWKGRFREKIFQTRRITSTAGSNLVYPVRHGLPSTTLTVDIPVTSDSRGGRLTGWWMLPTNYTVREGSISITPETIKSNVS